MVSIKQMKYADSYEEAYKRPMKILAQSTYKGYNYAILDGQGSHPRAYIGIPDNHPCHGISSHHIWWIGGNDQRTFAKEVTYSSDHLQFINMPTSWIIGWDYGEYGKSFYNPYGRKFTTYEILLDVFDVINELITIQKHNIKVIEEENW